jgi:hypothetical protein
MLWLPVMRTFRCLLAALTFAFLGAGSIQSQSTGIGTVTRQIVASAQAVTYCELLEHSEKFKNQVIRVQAKYETDFEKSVITSASCPTPIPMIWVNFDDHWQSRTTRSVRKAVSNVKWRVPLDVVFIGRFKTEGPYGHMDMYQLSIEVFKVEAASGPKNARASPKS